MNSFLSSVVAALLLSVIGNEACRLQGEGCADHIPCCGGLKCDNGGNVFGFCKVSVPPYTGGGSVNPPPNPPAPSPSGGGQPASGYLISKDEFREAVTINGYGAPSDEQYENINKGAVNGKVTTKRELAMFLANILHESDGLKAKEEYSPIISTDPAYPGKNYHGRGYIQLSHIYNYRDASFALYGDDRLARNPEQVATNDKIAWDTTFWFWGNRVHDKAGVAEGKFGVTTRAINGGYECDGAYQHKARRRFAMYTKILNIFVPGETPIESGCYN
ncbi:uncharacterized protein LOC129601429 [Paramacrobiotus metropolitanus]|uniref:uncharacterized protein LOC129601429 n=1 Tax=Paramacrobiotus metropolitanus TaxID=2943436 RepID=UPI0024461EFF|nr:uncharacterized protein LOC129601429 [Paramacrobiotus metropolitanus]